jgi:hypothetical protein
VNNIERTTHFTTKAEEICQGLLDHISPDVILVDAFAGDKDLVRLFPNNKWELYDIKPLHADIHKRDSLLNPPDYSGKWIVINPPYLAKNKCEDKTLYEKYNLDDWYKCAIKSAMDCEGGIFIIPTNFFTDEKSKDLRKEFLSKFKVLKLNIFTEPIFETTTYSICSCAFVKGETDNVEINTFPQRQTSTIHLGTGRIGEEFFSVIEGITPCFTRLTQDRGIREGEYITNIKLYAIDNRQERIRLEYDTEHFYGKPTDRTFATLVCDKELSEEEQKYIIKNFNYQLNKFRDDNLNLVLTNYRDYNRKRIGFDFAYRLATKVLEEKVS